MRNPPETLTVDSRVEDGRRIVALAGDLDIATAELAASALVGDVAVLDLSDLEFMDSSGVRVLIAACAERSDRLIARGVHPNVRRILDMTGVSDLLTFEQAAADRIGSRSDRLL